MSTYTKFCQYIKDKLFNDSMKGSYVSLVIDDKFINEACRVIGVNKNTLYSAVKTFMWHDIWNGMQGNPTLSFGIVALQLYTAYLRGDNAGSNGYRPALAELLGVDDVSIIAEWLDLHQEKVWDILYDWCEKNDFQIYRTESSYGPWRYIRYILDCASNTLNQNDLKRFGYDFYIHGVTANEELSEVDFWRALGGKGEIANNQWHTKRCNSILLENLGNDHVFDQIYSYFCYHWDGKYIIPSFSKNHKERTNSKYLLFLSTDKLKLDVREDDNKVFEIGLNKPFEDALTHYYRFKRDGIIVFKPSEFYEDYWEETRYIDNGDEGLALIRKNKIYEYYHLNIIGSYGVWKLVTLKKGQNYSTREFFSSEVKPYKLDGGLKLGYHKYMEGGDPILKVIRDSKFWVDGESIEGQSSDEYFLDFKKGRHIIKFKGYSPIIIQVIACKEEPVQWKKEYSHWQANRKEGYVKPMPCTYNLDYGSFIGLNFYGMLGDIQPSMPIVKRWILAHQGKGLANENNIIIKQLKEANYGKRHRV